MARGGRTRLPEPLTPRECNLNGYEFMPLLIMRLRHSEFNVTANDAEWRAGVNLWCSSWYETPAGSLPDDDQLLSYYADIRNGLSDWMKVKSMAMHGWIKCADGRFYHPVVASEALKAWDKRKRHQEKLELSAERKRRWRERKRNASRNASRNADVQ